MREFIFDSKVSVLFLVIFQREDDPLVTGTRIVATAMTSESDTK